NRDEMPPVYAALSGSDRIHVGESPPNGFPEGFDYSICLECPSLERTGLSEHLSQLPIINLDHHLGNELYGESNWVDTGAPALGEMIYRLAGALGVAVDAATATGLYTAVMTDTGGFRFANTTAETFKVAAALVRDGARPEQVSQWVYESQSEATVRLLGEMLHSLELHHGGRIATVALLDEMFERAGATAADAEDLVDHPRSIAGVDAVALLRQLGPGRFKGSLRSRGDVDVEVIARSYGGGGHKNAAGFEATGAVEDLTAALVESLRDALG
ncbi:MAG: bifunctional oligoribonuclease/PAP phosphatase NrnA, partial [Acidobacteria bacterium]|nr:bifunctional oligoribonuclease/PAP phosphatase NrnA [Acidobacteriota bacterium]